MSTNTVRIALIGAGNLGRRFARVIADKHEELLRKYNIDLRLVGIADTRGAALDPAGLDGTAICALKEKGGSVCELPDVGRPGMTGHGRYGNSRRRLSRRRTV